MQAVTPLLRPHQVQESQEELRRLEQGLAASKQIRGLQFDRPEASKRKVRLTKQLEELTPTAFPVQEKDTAVKRWRQLASSIKEDMPSGEEMRRNPPGARQKQTSWHERHKHEVQEWKNLGLRLRAGGDVPAPEFKHEDSVEILRGWRGSHDLSMDGAQIPKTKDIHFGGNPADVVVFSDDEIAALTRINPDLASKLAVLDADARQTIKILLSQTTPAPEKPKEKLKWQKDNSERMKRYADHRRVADANGIKVRGLKMTELEAALKERGLLPEG